MWCKGWSAEITKQSLGMEVGIMLFKLLQVSKRGFRLEALQLSVSRSALLLGKRPIANPSYDFHLRCKGGLVCKDVLSLSRSLAYGRRKRKQKMIGALTQNT